MYGIVCLFIFFRFFFPATFDFYNFLIKYQLSAMAVCFSDEPSPELSLYSEAVRFSNYFVDSEATHILFRIKRAYQSVAFLRQACVSECKDFDKWMYQRVERGTLRQESVSKCRDFETSACIKVWRF